ncbi:MAG: hypothetical protein ACYC9M_05955 [Desulfobulbaceae bacterium]
MRFSLLIFICLATLTLPACGTLKSTKLLAPAAFGMKQIAPRVYVDPKMTAKQRLTLAEAIATARERIHSFYGNVAANPEIIACATEQCFQRFGGVTARAKAYGASKLLLSPRGLTAPIVAHEWSHAELCTRAGGYFAAKDIPRWFDEGLAVLLSNEPTHSEDIWLAVNEAGIATPALNELESREKWLAAVKKYGDASTNKEQYKVVYATAGHEVRTWYREAGKAGLAQLIEAIKQGRPFAQAYQEALGGTLPSRSSTCRNIPRAPGPEDNMKP